jgi:hypothetical protein
MLGNDSVGARSGNGIAYLGVTPRTYFEDPNASMPTDAAREAQALGEWRSQQHRGGDNVEREVTAAELAANIAADIDPDHLAADEDDHEDLNGADIFVEVKTAHFLAALGLPPIN